MTVMFAHLTDRRIFAIILTLYLLLGFAYSITNPILESPDELINYENIRYMVENKKLPVLQPGEFSKAHHPPLYYLIGAVAFGWVPNDHLNDLADNAAQTAGIAPQFLQHMVIVNQVTENRQRIGFHLSRGQRNGIADAKTHAQMFCAQDSHMALISSHQWLPRPIRSQK